MPSLCTLWCHLELILELSILITFQLLFEYDLCRVLLVLGLCYCAFNHFKIISAC